MSLRTTLTALALACASAAPAFAAVEVGSAITCADSFISFTNVGYVGCRGPLTGDVAALGSVSFAGVGSLRQVGLTGDASGAFTGHVDTSVFGLLELGRVQYGNFVIGVQGGGTYSLYLFTGRAGGLGEIAYDTFGNVDADGISAPAFGSAALFAGAVPEPTQAALLLAGLAVMGFVASRRTS